MMNYLLYITQKLTLLKTAVKYFNENFNKILNTVHCLEQQAPGCVVTGLP